MFNLFKERQDKPSVLQPIFQHFADKLDRQQRKFADWLNDRTKKYSIGKQKRMVVIICVLLGCCSSFVILTALFEKSHDPPLVQNISVPKSILKNQVDHNQPLLLPKRESENLQRFLQYMDSLRLDRFGKAKYDSILQARPGLMDSLGFIIETYHLNPKTIDHGKADTTK